MALVGSTGNMTDVTAAENQDYDRPASPASSASSTSSTKSERSSHDWIARQLRLRRQEYVEALEITVKIVSWNVNGKRVAEDLTDLLLEHVEPGIYAIGSSSLSLSWLTPDYKKWTLEKAHM
jgi:hypothetical protein